jgi:DDE superfamily endonuclease
MSTFWAKQIHIVLDNLSAHKTKAVKEFLEQNPRVRFHFTPTYSSWLNQVELWFAKIQRDVISRGVFTSVAELAANWGNTFALTQPWPNHFAGPILIPSVASDLTKSPGQRTSDSPLHSLPDLRCYIRPFCVDRDGGFDPAENRPTLFTNFRDSTVRAC